VRRQAHRQPLRPQPRQSPNPNPNPAQIEFGPVALVNGRVFFSDRFIQPNYSANITALTGNLAAFSSTSPANSVSLTGRVEGSGTLEITGELNPLTVPLSLDLRAAVRELELPPLTPYSVKYAGYGIERGKLSVNLSYRINAQGQLQASNQIVLNQLRFGDRIPDSTAPNLPIKLAVALLADRQGVIDINLPVSGSLNDPEFRLGPIIVRLVVNLIGRALTAPFALIANALGGGADDLQQVDFDPGTASLNSAARERLNTVAKALTDRPALRLTVQGQASLEAERAAYRRAQLDAQVLAEKRRQAARNGLNPQDIAAVGAQEYPALLLEVYRRADIAKPRNLIGLAKDLPQPEMEALLLAAIPATDDLMRELAVQRGVAVKDYLASQQVPETQLFLGNAGKNGGAAPSTAADTATDAATAPWQPRAELKLEAR
jgi:outer membrane protein OmpA-like peptidoglycan-associated protein